MALIFEDNLLAIEAGGVYTLMGFADGTWNAIYTIAGPDTGNIPVQPPSYGIVVDTTIYLPGSTYPFKWVDISGAESNIIHLTIPQPGYLLLEDGGYLLQETSYRIYVS